MNHDDIPATAFFSKATEGPSPSTASEVGINDLPNVTNYKVEKLIGCGGFGKIYRAARQSDGKLFAIKLLRVPGGMSTDLRQRFLREATVLCQLEHPRIISFRELGISGDDLYLVMDYIDCASWREISQNLTPTKRIAVAARIIDHCLDALVYAHCKGIVHRDIKPSNILLENRNGKLHVWLADFGLAKNYLQAGHSGVTSDHEIAGTFSYLAPELLGGVKFFKPASDQYSLAATLYEMLAGRPPIVIPAGGNPLQEIRRHRIPPIAQLAPNIPSELANWIHRGLATEPKNRFETMQHMRDLLPGVRATP
jgi:eukaryotic-like serine/threonine-protein kinase